MGALTEDTLEQRHPSTLREVPAPWSEAPGTVSEVAAPWNEAPGTISDVSAHLSAATTLLFEIEPTDPTTFVSVALLLLATSAVASLIPSAESRARRPDRRPPARVTSSWAQRDYKCDCGGGQGWLEAFGV